MRDQVLVYKDSLRELEREVADLKGKLSAAFGVEEMDAIREQLAERAAHAERAHEELEWNLRLELARVREAEASCAHAASEMRRAASSIAILLGDEEPAHVPLRNNGARRRMFA